MPRCPGWSCRFFDQICHGKAGREASLTDTGELIPRIPRVGGRHSGIGGRGQVAIEIIRLSTCSKHRLLVVCVVAGTRERRRGVGPCKCAAGFDPVANKIIGVGFGLKQQSLWVIVQFDNCWNRVVAER